MGVALPLAAGKSGRFARDISSRRQWGALFRHIFRQEEGSARDAERNGLADGPDQAKPDEDRRASWGRGYLRWLLTGWTAAGNRGWGADAAAMGHEKRQRGCHSTPPSAHRNGACILSQWN